MNKKVDIRVELDSSCDSPQVIIRTARETELIEKIVYSIEHCLSGDPP